MEKVKVQIVGATGYAGGELYRLLLGHPRVEVVSLTAKIDQTEPISKHFMVLPSKQGSGRQDYDLCTVIHSNKCGAQCDFSLSEADVPTYQSIHRPVGDHIGQYFLQYLGLVRRLFEWKTCSERMIFRHRNGVGNTISRVP